MIAEILFWILLSWLLGFALATLALPGPRKRRLRIALSPLLGMGLVSLLEFLGLCLGIEPLAPICVLALVLVISARLLRLPRVQEHTQLALHAQPMPPAPAACPRSLCLFVLFLAAIALLGFGLRSYAAPHGESDAMNIWNLHARFLFRAPEHWRDLFASTILDHSHPDYPLLLPAFVAHTWSRLGSDTTLVPVLVALGFSASLVFLLYEALRDRGLPVAACLGALALVASPSFTTFASGQLAGIPLAIACLASVVLVTQCDATGKHRLGTLLLAGFCAGLAAWTKNEGQLFFLTFLFCSVLYLHRRRPDRPWPGPLALLIGAAPALLALLYFKMILAPSNDLVGSSTSTTILTKISDPSRYLDVALGVAAGILRLGDGFLVLIVALLLLLPRRPKPAADSTHSSGAGLTARLTTSPATGLALGLATVTLLGYACVYLTLSGEVTQHMDTSLPRLLLQVWPLILFGLLTMKPLDLPRKSQRESQHTHHGRDAQT